MKDSQRRAMWAKRMNYNKLNPYMAQKMIDESKGMPKAKWERLWRIAHSHPRNKVTGTELTRDTNYISKQIYGKTYSKLNKAQKDDVNHTSADSRLWRVN